MLGLVSGKGKIVCLAALAALAALVMGGCRNFRLTGIGRGPDSKGAQADGEATLVGLATTDDEGEMRSAVRGTIVAIDGHEVDLPAASAIGIDAGCHIIETEVEYKVARLNTAEVCPAFRMWGACDRKVERQSGHTYFAIPVQRGKRYELSALMSGDVVSPHFVEVDAELGTVAKFVPVAPDTKSCAAGIPVG